MFDVGAKKFESRDDAGELLAKKLDKFKENAVVVAIPRGGIVVGAAVAKRLKIPLDLIIIRKLGAPGNPELAIGATTSKGGIVLDRDLIDKLDIPSKYVHQEHVRQLSEARRRQKLYLKEDRTELIGKLVILVDDGIATGSTIEAAVHAVREELPDKIIIAAPVAPIETADRLKLIADEVVVLSTPEPFYAIGEFYSDFPQVSDQEVVELLQEFYLGKRDKEVR